MPKVSPIFRLAYFEEGDVITGLGERSRFLTIDRQLEAIFTFLGDGVVTGWELTETQGVPLSITVSKGAGVVSGIAATSDGDIILNNLEPGNQFGDTVNYIYAQLLGQTPYTTKVNILATTEFQNSSTFLPLGTVTADINNNLTIDTSETTGRKQLSFIETILSVIQEHLHTGQPGEPSKIDLQKHVKGVLDSANIPSIPASKISGGIIDPKRFKLSHDDLSDTGTLRHAELDSLVEKLQSVNRLLFGDIMTANLAQLILSMKHVWPSVDEFFPNFFGLIPGIGNNSFLNPDSFIDINATTAEVDYLNHRIRGISLPAQEFGQVTINSVQDWETGDYNSAFIKIVETASAYGYGYGYGSGLDYFDVLETTQFDFLEGTDTATGFAGSQIGYGVTDIDGNDFESFNAGAYSYGWGFEYGAGFPTTLTSTIVTLNPLTLALQLHDKDLDGIADTGSNDYDNSIVPPNYAPPDASLPVSQKDDFIRLVGQTPLRSTTIDQSQDGANNIPSDLNAFTTFINTFVDNNKIVLSDQSAAYTTWTNGVDLTLNNFITFSVVQVSDPYDEDWTFDHSFELFFEFSNDAKTERSYFQYKDPITSGTLFFDVSKEYFKEIGEFDSDLGRNKFQLSAEVDNDNLTFLTAFDIATSNVKGITDIALLGERLRNLTGVILYSNTSLGHDNLRESTEGATSITFPQGQREGLASPNPTGMLADIDQIFVGGPFGFANNKDTNKIEDLIISFPDPVDFTTISWIDEQPGDSIIYIQLSPLETPLYDDVNIFTNKTRAEIDLRNDTFGDVPFLENTNLFSSGSEFSEQFQNVRGLRLRVVLLPTSDLRVAPTINSITVNFVSNTQGGEFVVTSAEDWLDARLTDNVQVSGEGSVSILLGSGDTGRIKNVIYGTDRSVVERDENFNQLAKKYTGTNLPRTVTQILNSQPAGFTGFVTDLKKLGTGDVIVMDRDSSRLVRVDQNYNLKSILASEKVFLTTSDTGAGSAGDEATIVKAIFNRELGDNGILYIVFSHQLAAWPTPDAGINVFPDQIFIRSKGQTINLGGLFDAPDNDTLVVPDRGILSFKLDTTTSNFIEGSENPVLEARLAGSQKIVNFYLVPEGDEKQGKIEIPIEKIGSKGTFSEYSLVYAPIQGIVAFDVDSEGRYMILKQNNPYSWDVSEGTGDGIWYSRLNPGIFWSSWLPSASNDTSLETNASTMEGTESDTSLENPNFFINNFFGNKGSVERVYDWLLFVFSGDKKVFITKKEDGVFRQPTIIPLISTTTTPMAARLDPLDVTNSDFNYIYVALSDLRRGTTNESGRSRVIKIDAGSVVENQVIWEWGSGVAADEFGRPTTAVSVNDVRPLLDTDSEGVIVST